MLHFSVSLVGEGVYSGKNTIGYIKATNKPNIEVEIEQNV